MVDRKKKGKQAFLKSTNFLGSFRYREAGLQNTNFYDSSTNRKSANFFQNMTQLCVYSPKSRLWKRFLM